MAVLTAQGHGMLLFHAVISQDSLRLFMNAGLIYSAIISALLYLSRLIPNGAL